MDVKLESGTYVVAVSGGVDSMVLLNLLSKNPDLRLVVAHFDHGIRPDSHEDRQLVQQTANELQLPFVFHEGKLGNKASEDQARQARYEFLHQVRLAADAQAVITAHHQDDALETAVHNLLRGTGRKGLSSLQDNANIARPLLHLSKKDLQDYARRNKLQWREDSTNKDEKYTRNYIRRQIIPKLSDKQHQKLLKTLNDSRRRNSEIDRILDDMLTNHQQKSGLDRKWFVGLPHLVARELMATWLRSRGIRDFDKKLIEQLVVAAKIQRTGSRANVNKDYKLQITAKYLALLPVER